MSNLGVQLALLVLLIAFLAAFRQQLIFELSGISLLIFGRTEPGLYLYALIMLPGTVLHELSHWLMAEFLRVPTGAITILPGEDLGTSREARLGSVATGTSDPFRGFLIGIAPMVTGLLALVILTTLLRDGWQAGWHPGWIVLLVYGLIVVGNSMLISQADRRTWPAIGIMLLLILGVLYLARVHLVIQPDSRIPTLLSTLNLVLGVTAGLNLGMIMASLAARRLAEKLTGKRIGRQRSTV
jgi:hypothetical protein